MAFELKQLSSNGTPSGQASASDSVFGIEPNRHCIYLAVRRELVNARAGTANSKTRSEVRGGGRKPWKQKGTGRARVGSIRSPLWVGGGTIFGPKPRTFKVQLNKKVRRLAMRSALSAVADKTSIVESFEFLNEPKTKLMAAFLKSAELTDKKVLILADYKEEAPNLHLACRNLSSVKLSLPGNLSVRDLLNADAILMSQPALQVIDARYRTDD